MTRKLMALLAAPAMLVALAGCDSETTTPRETRIRHVVQTETVDKVCGEGECTVTFAGKIFEQASANTVSGSTVWLRIASEGGFVFLDGPSTTSGAGGAFSVAYSFDEASLPLAVRVCAGAEKREDDNLCAYFDVQ